MNNTLKRACREVFEDVEIEIDLLESKITFLEQELEKAKVLQNVFLNRTVKAEQRLVFLETTLTKTAKSFKEAVDIESVLSSTEDNSPSVEDYEQMEMEELALLEDPTFWEKRL